jgi:hypothetical protein
MRKVFGVLFLMMMAAAFLAAPVAVFATSDSAGVITDLIGKISHGMLSNGEIVALVGILGPLVYRLIQKGLQRLPTRWRWVNNRLTVGILDRLMSYLFGKTVLLYNMRIVAAPEDTEAAKAAARKVAMDHLARNGGILQEVNRALRSS